MTLPTTSCFLIVHGSGSSLASPFVLKPSFVTPIILWVTVVGCSASTLKQIMSPTVRVSGSAGFMTTMLPTGMAGSMLPV